MARKRPRVGLILRAGRFIVYIGPITEAFWALYWAADTRRIRWLRGL